MEELNMEKIGKRIIIKGEMLHHVGFRPYLLLKALRLRIKNFEAENIDDDGKQVVVLLIGDTKQISEFINYVKIKKLPLPDTTKVIDVSEEEIDTKADIDIVDINEYRKWLGVEQDNNIVQGGLKIIDILKNETNKGIESTNKNIELTNKNLELLRVETNDNFKKMDENFKRMDEKYDAISKGMFAVVERLEKRDEMFEARIEKTEKNIESLLKILTEKKS